MSGIKDIEILLASMSPALHHDNFVFCTTTQLSNDDIQALNPKGLFIEDEGTTLILTKSVAEQRNLPFSALFSLITLTVHSSLEAVGLTAAVAKQLAEKGISANVVAAYYHDHIFVQAEKAQLALSALKELQLNCRSKLENNG